MKLSVLQISGARPSEPKIALHDLSLTATVADVKRLLVEKTGFPVEQQALLCGQVLADNATVEELNKDGC